MSNADRGFASMSPEAHRKIASAGGKASHKKGTGHEWDHDSATLAGRKGGQVTAARLKVKREEAAQRRAETS